MIRGLVGKVFVLALGIVAVLSMAPEPERSNAGSNADDAQRKAALRRMLTDPRDDAGTGSASPVHQQAGGEAIRAGRSLPAVEKVALTTRQPAAPALGGRDAPPEYLARLRAARAESGEESAGKQSGPVFTVTASAVNLRAGPTTGSRIIGRLTRGQSAELLRDTGNGWAEIRAIHSGAHGFMALRFLAPAGD